MISQVLLGEALEIVEPASGRDSQRVHPDWAAVRAPDGYEGFVTLGSLLTCTESTAADWKSKASTTSLGTGLNPIDRDHAGTGTDAPRHAPWGAKLASAADGTIELPDGGRVHATDPTRIIAEAVRTVRYPRDTATIARTAMEWLGTPYLWGGRTGQGADCSGFVQSVFGLHGFALARDSGDQFDAGPKVEGPDSGHGGAAGDLWFFAFGGRPVSHVGICLGDARMIHASETRGCVMIDDLGESEFGRRLTAGFVGAVRVEA
jgi:cell wall-associated NlpC family hydrolase